MKYDISKFSHITKEGLQSAIIAIANLEQAREAVTKAEAEVEKVIVQYNLEALFPPAEATGEAVVPSKARGKSPTKGIVVPDDYKAELVAFLRAQSEPISVDGIREMWVDQKGQRYSKATISQRMPILAKAGVVAVSSKGTRKFYSAPNEAV